MLAARIAHIMIKIILMVALGFILNKTGVIKREDEDVLSDVLMKCAMPCNIIAAAAADVKGTGKGDILVLFLISLAIYLVTLGLGLLVGKLLKFTPGRRIVFASLVTFANTGFIGMPIMQELYGDTGLVSAVIFNLAYNVVFFTIGVHLFDHKSGGGLKTIFGNPMTISSPIMVVLFFTGIRLPDVLQDTLSTVGAMVVPLSMIIIGSSLVGLDWKDLIRDKASYLVSFLRLIAIPLAVLLILRIFRLPENTVRTCTIMSALPAGSLNVIMARKYHMEESFASLTTIQTMILFVAALPVILLLLNATA